MRESLNELQHAGATLLAVDPHDRASARRLLKESGFSTSEVHYPLLMDPSLTVSATYGVAFQMKIHTEWSNRPATFVIDRDGVIRAAWRSKTYSDRPKPAEILASLRRLAAGRD